jgi:hypothetical protein
MPLPLHRKAQQPRHLFNRRTRLVQALLRAHAQGTHGHRFVERARVQHDRNARRRATNAGQCGQPRCVGEIELHEHHIDRTFHERADRERQCTGVQQRESGAEGIAERRGRARRISFIVLHQENANHALGTGFSGVRGVGVHGADGRKVFCILLDPAHDASPFNFVILRVRAVTPGTKPPT